MAAASLGGVWGAPRPAPVVHAGLLVAQRLVQALPAQLQRVRGPSGSVARVRLKGGALADDALRAGARPAGHSG